MQLLEVKRGQITLAVEGVEVRTQCGVQPDAGSRVAHAAVVRRTLHRHDVEPRAQALERFVAEQSLHRLAAVLQKLRHLGLGVALGHVGDVDAMQRVGRLLQSDKWRDSTFAAMGNEDVARHHLVGQRASGAVMRVAQLNGDVDRVARHRHQEHVLHRLAHGLGLGGRNPLLKQARERVAVDDRAAAMVAHGDVAVAGHWHLIKVHATAPPPRQTRHLVEKDILLDGIARKGIVQPEGRVGEVAVKVHRPSGQGGYCHRHH